MYFCQLEESMKAILPSNMFHNTETQNNIYKTTTRIHKERTVKKKRQRTKDVEDCGEWVREREKGRETGQERHYPECCQAAESVISLGQLKIKVQGQNLTCERMHGTSTYNQCHHQMEQNKTASFTGSRHNHRKTIALLSTILECHNPIEDVAHPILNKTLSQTGSVKSTTLKCNSRKTLETLYKAVFTL